MAVTLYYGPCQDGPYNGKPMAHGVETCRVAIDRHTSKAVPGIVAGPESEYKFGEYRWDGAAWRRPWREGEFVSVFNTIAGRLT